LTKEKVWIIFLTKEKILITIENNFPGKIVTLIDNTDTENQFKQK